MDKEVVDVLVEFDYDAEEKDELTIRPGDIVRNVVRSEGGWWEGELNGKVGVFPDNFVKVIEPKEENVHRKDILSHHRKDEAPGHHKKEDGHHKKDDVHKKDGMNVKELKNVLSRQPGSIHGPGPALPGVTKRNRDSVMKRKKFAKVAYSYSPENQDELRLEMGDVVEVLNEEEEGWWRGAVRGQQGLFPSNFVETITAPAEGDENEKKEQNDDKPPAKVTEIKGKKVKGVGLGNIFGNEEIKLRSTKDNKSSQQSQDETPPRPIKPTGSIIKKSSKVQKAKVIFGYQAHNEDELTLQEGEIITVLDREIEDSGWWLGEVHGKRGVFPDNFVELLPLEETKPRKPPPPSLPVPPPTSGEAKKINKPVSSEPKSGTLKKDAHDRGSVPPVPGKKPDLPPPMRKPTQRQDHGKPVNVKVENDLDVIESHENLKSLTASRPKNPNRRPPSMELLHNKENGDANSEELSWMKDKSATLGHDSKSHVEVENEKNSESVVKRGPALPPHPKAEPRSPGISGSGTYERPLTIIGEPVLANSRDVDELRRELQHLKENTVSKVAYDELHTEVKSMREQLVKMRQTFDKRLYELMDEMDEEKKIRLSTQVEIERIKKLHMSVST